MGLGLVHSSLTLNKFFFQLAEDNSAFQKYLNSEAFQNGNVYVILKLAEGNLSGKSGNYSFPWINPAKLASISFPKIVKMLYNIITCTDTNNYANALSTTKKKKKRKK